MSTPPASPSPTHPYDHAHLRDVILGSGDQFAIGWSLGDAIALPVKNPKNIIICGMGGSALPADIVLDVFDPAIPVFVWRSYGLPAVADEKSLIICTSYSGNTEETLSAWGDAYDAGLKPLAITVGGHLKTAAEGAGLPVLLLPDTGIQPRYAAGFAFGILSAILARVGAIDVDPVMLTGLASRLDIAALEQQGSALATAIFTHVPVIVAPQGYGSVARIWKIKINENAKAPAYFNVIPEMNHNEMVGYTNASSEGSFSLVLLETSDVNDRIQKRMEIVPRVLEPVGVTCHRVALPGNSKIERVWNGLILGDWVSYHLSALLKQDPTPVEMVEQFKALMKDA